MRTLRGFSLLELMLVLALMGLVSALAVASLGGDPGRAYEAQLERLVVRMSDAESQARRRGWVLGLAWTERGYRFMKLRTFLPEPEWIALGREGPGDSRDWPEGLQLQGSPLQINADGLALYRIWSPDGETLGPELNWQWPGGSARIDRQGQWHRGTP